jgi:putative zinc finger/helix-turn-helix YgiT family protein
MTTRRTDWPYEASGLRNVVLLGVDVSRCSACGEEEVKIPAIEGLHRAIAQTIVRKQERLAPPEIRFLRKCLGLSAVDLAKHMGTTPETVSRWEHGATSMGVTADRLLRMMVVSQEPPRGQAPASRGQASCPPTNNYPLDTLKSVASRAARQRLLRLRRERDNGWTLAGAA